MSSQAIRNNINSSIRRVISDVKRKAISEENKKVIDLKDQLLTPDQIIRMLSADINQDSCSIEGKNKMLEKANKLKSQLNQIDEIAQSGLKVMSDLEDKIGSISSKVEISNPNIPDPIEGIRSIIEPLKVVTQILNYIVIAAPAILAASSGPAANGAIIANTNNKINMAKSKIAEFKNLFASLPKLLDRYVSMADQVFNKINKMKKQIQFIVDEIQKLKAFIIYLEMNFEDKCNKLTSPTVPSIPIIPEPQIIPPPLTLAQVIANTQELYGNILQFLIARGDNKAIKRVYALGVEFQRTTNTKVEVIDI